MFPMLNIIFTGALFFLALKLDRFACYFQWLWIKLCGEPEVLIPCSPCKDSGGKENPCESPTCAASTHRQDPILLPKPMPDVPKPTSQNEKSALCLESGETSCRVSLSQNIVVEFNLHDQRTTGGQSVVTTHKEPHAFSHVIKEPKPFVVTPIKVQPSECAVDPLKEPESKPVELAAAGSFEVTHSKGPFLSSEEETKVQPFSVVISSKEPFPDVIKQSTCVQPADISTGSTKEPYLEDIKESTFKGPSPTNETCPCYHVIEETPPFQPDAIPFSEDSKPADSLCGVTPAKESCCVVQPSKGSSMKTCPKNSGPCLDEIKHQSTQIKPLSKVTSTKEIGPLSNVSKESKPDETKVEGSCPAKDPCPSSEVIKETKPVQPVCHSKETPNQDNEECDAEQVEQRVEVSRERVDQICKVHTACIGQEMMKLIKKDFPVDSSTKQPTHCQEVVRETKPGLIISIQETCPSSQNEDSEIGASSEEQHGKPVIEEVLMEQVDHSCKEVMKEFLPIQSPSFNELNPCSEATPEVIKECKPKESDDGSFVVTPPHNQDECHSEEIEKPSPEEEPVKPFIEEVLMEKVDHLCKIYPSQKSNSCKEVMKEFLPIMSPSINELNLCSEATPEVIKECKPKESDDGSFAVTHPHNQDECHSEEIEKPPEEEPVKPFIEEVLMEKVDHLCKIYPSQKSNSCKEVMKEFLPIQSPSINELNPCSEATPEVIKECKPKESDDGSFVVTPPHNQDECHSEEIEKPSPEEEPVIEEVLMEEVEHVCKVHTPVEACQEAEPIELCSSEEESKSIQHPCETTSAKTEEPRSDITYSKESHHEMIPVTKHAEVTSKTEGRDPSKPKAITTPPQTSAHELKPTRDEMLSGQKMVSNAKRISGSNNDEEASDPNGESDSKVRRAKGDVKHSGASSNHKMDQLYEALLQMKKSSQQRRESRHQI